jgi:hypothetical protein
MILFSALGNAGSGPSFLIEFRGFQRSAGPIDQYSWMSSRLTASAARTWAVRTTLLDVFEEGSGSALVIVLSRV